MLRKFLPALAIVSMLLAACGQQAEPTLSPEEVSGTAVAAAWTIVAETQAAIPTNTPVPPTNTPEPTPTPLPTLEPTATIEFVIPTATTASQTQGECEGMLNFAEAGPQSNVRIENETGGPVTFSLWLSKNAHGQCGFVYVTPLAKNEKRVLSLPKGVYLLSFFGDSAGNGSCNVNNRVGDNHLFVVKIKKNSCVVP